MRQTRTVRNCGETEQRFYRLESRSVWAFWRQSWWRREKWRQEICNFITLSAIWCLCSLSLLSPSFLWIFWTASPWRTFNRLRRKPNFCTGNFNWCFCVKWIIWCKYLFFSKIWMKNTFFYKFIQKEQRILQRHQLQSQPKSTQRSRIYWNQDDHLWYLFICKN